MPGSRAMASRRCVSAASKSLCGGSRSPPGQLHLDDTQQPPAIGKTERLIRPRRRGLMAGGRATSLFFPLLGAREQVGRGQRRLLQVMTAPGPVPLDKGTLDVIASQRSDSNAKTQPSRRTLPARFELEVLEPHARVVQHPPELQA